jgi:diaminopimelate epimerase/ribosomal protein S18 acetylase RimI-like enzyme
MKPTERSAGQLQVMPIFEVNPVVGAIRQDILDVYQGAFAQPPYNEAFTSEDVEEALESILEQNGNLLVGELGGKAVSLAAGYAKPDGVYYIEELAVLPEAQGKGYGRRTLEALLETEAASSAERLEIRTTMTNEKAIALYESEGFYREVGTEVVAQVRQSGDIALDTRVYLSRPPLAEAERLNNLKRVAIAYPSGNTTAIVFDQLADTDRKQLNSDLMQTWIARNSGQPEVEQCCFVLPPNNPAAVARVEMFGGEFCGNATRSVAWLVTKGEDYAGLIEVSGVDRPLAFQVKDDDVTAEMPLPNGGSLARPVTEGALVQLDGIAQLVVTDAAQRQARSPRELLNGLLRTNAYDLANQPAVGVTYFDQATGKAEFCVWVNAVDTVFDETACGSGTCAIGVASADRSKTSVDLGVVQPSGETIRTQAAYDGAKVARSYISGKVDILYDGELKLA